MSYGSAYLTGYLYEDKVCIDAENCVEDHAYILMATSDGAGGYDGLTEPIDGIMGLCLGYEMIFFGGGSFNCEVAPIYYQDETFTGIFSFYINGIDKDSFIDFNGYNIERIRD